MNAWVESLSFTLPPPGEGVWYRVLDTAGSPPADVCEAGAADPWTEPACTVAPRSVVLFAGRLPPEAIP